MPRESLLPGAGPVSGRPVPGLFERILALIPVELVKEWWIVDGVSHFLYVEAFIGDRLLIAACGLSGGGGTVSGDASAQLCSRCLWLMENDEILASQLGYGDDEEDDDVY